MLFFEGFCRKLQAQKDKTKSIGSSRKFGLMYLWQAVARVSGLKHRRVLGEAVRTYRRRARLSQEKLAEKAQLHPVYISAVERGAKTISMDALVRISVAMKVRLRDLVWDI
jgi:ribosome-binding protein aMBF1 (putative translation factor)